MNKEKWEDWDYEEEPKKIGYVSVDGNWIPIDMVEFLNVEEDLHGRDLVTFIYNNQTYESLVVIKYS